MKLTKKNYNKLYEYINDLFHENKITFHEYSEIFISLDADVRINYYKPNTFEEVKKKYINIYL